MARMVPAVSLVVLALVGVPSWQQHAAAMKRNGEFEIRVVDEHTNQPIAVRMHLRDARGRPVKPPKLPYWNDHFVFQDTVVLDLRPGRYTFEIEHGPEYPVRYGNFMIDRGATDNRLVTMGRFVDMQSEGWWSGDLHIHRPLDDIPLLMRAEDLAVAPVISWWNQNRTWKNDDVPSANPVHTSTGGFYQLLAGEDERGGGALLYFNLPSPLPLPDRKQHEYPPMATFLEQAKKQYSHCHVDVEKPFWWDMPVWIALGLADSIGLANNHMQRGGMLANEAWGKPRDPKFYPGPLGNGQWSQDIYYDLLNCGIRIPPSAGSASGVLPNPVGYNRVYVHCGKQLDYDAWWQGLRAGRVIVTNGPLLRPLVNGKYPGHVFRASPGNTVTLSPQVNLATRDKINYLEVIKDGKVAHQVRLDEYKNRKGHLPEIVFQESGWMLIRAVTTNAKTFRFASTGPYYVDIGGQPRISTTSAQFFVDWVKQRIANITLNDPQQRAQVLDYQQRALRFWQAKLDQANAP